MTKKELKLDRKLRNRYSRQTILPFIGEDGQAQLLQSTAVVIGCGALGSNIATLLARAGVGKVKIVDRDFIEEHNLQRQVLFDEDDIKAGLPKAIAAERHLRKVNSTVEIEGIVADVNYTNIERLCSGSDVILDGLDNAETRLLINDAALKLGIPWVYGGALMSTGMTMTIIPGKTPCLRCIMPSLPDPASVPTCETAGILGTVPAIIGALQATEAIKLLLGPEDINHGLFILDPWQVSYTIQKIEKRDTCRACQGAYDYLEAEYEVKTASLCGQSRSIQIIDTRVGDIDLDQLSTRLKDQGDVTRSEYMVSFNIDDYEIIFFPDGRAIVKGTLDQALAKELYYKYVRIQ